MSNLLTVSRMRTWRNCRRKHRLEYLEGWRPKVEGEALRGGRIGHVGLEAWWGAEHGVRLDAALGAIEGRVDDPYERVAMEELLTGYDRQWAAGMDRYEVLAVEESFTLPLINPETGAASRTWLLAGKVDGVLRDLVTDQVVLLEHKLTAESFASDADTWWLKLGMDAQVSHYYLGAESLGHRPEGCLYDVLLRPRLRPLKATPPEKRKYKANGVLYANQRDRDETPEEYGARVRADIAENPAKYFQRRVIPRTDNDLREYLADTWAEGRMMREAEISGRAPRSPEACHRFGQCWAWDHCANGLRLEDHPEAFERLEDVHPELELDLQEAF